MALSAFRPQTDHYALAWSHDPAIDRDLEGFDELWRVAVETLDFGPVTKAGEKPSLFYFRPIDSSAMRRLVDLTGGKGLLVAELAFRMALVRVTDLGGEAPKIERSQDPDLRILGPMVSRKVCDWLDALSTVAGAEWASIVHELGSLVFERALSVPGKS